MELIFERGEASTSLSHILRQLPPPPKVPPSATPPPKEEPRSVIIQSNGSGCEKSQTQIVNELNLRTNSVDEGGFETMKKEVVIKDAVDNDKRSKSLFERQLSDILEATVGRQKRAKVTNSQTSPNKGGRLKKLFMKSDRKTSKENVEQNVSDISDKIRSAPSSPSTLRRFFRRSSFQKSLPKMSKARSETSLLPGREKSPKFVEEIISPKKLLKRSKSLNDGQSVTPKVEVLAKKSTNPFENNDDNLIVTSEMKSEQASEPFYHTINSETSPSKENDEVDRLYGGIVERQICNLNENVESRCFDCHLIQNGGNRVVSVYENLEDEIEIEKEEIPKRKKPILLPTRKVTISELIAECEDYVKTEQFTRDLSSEILNMFLQERSNHSSSNPFENDSDAFTPPATPTHHYDVPSNVVSNVGPSSVVSNEENNTEFQSNLPKFPFVHVDSRDSIYENGEAENKGSASVRCV